MKDILLLTKCELKKYFNTKIVFLGLLSTVLIIIFFSVSEYNDIMEFNRNPEYQKEILSWQEREENTIKFATESLGDTYYDETEREQITRRIEIAKYRLANNIPRYIYKNVWWFFNDRSFEWAVRLVIVIVVFAGCSNIGGEYTSKTIIQMSLLPYKRYKIICGKVLSMFVFGTMLYILVFTLGVLSGVIIHGTEGLDSRVALYFGKTIVEMNMGVYSIIIVLFKYAELLFNMSIVTFLSILFRSPIISSILGVFSATMLVPILTFLSMNFSFLNYSPFNNLDFRRYLDFGTVLPSIERGFESVVIAGITPSISTFIVGITILLLIWSSFEIFKRRDL